MLWTKLARGFASQACFVVRILYLLVTILREKVNFAVVSVHLVSMLPFLRWHIP